MRGAGTESPDDAHPTYTHVMGIRRLAVPGVLLLAASCGESPPPAAKAPAPAPAARVPPPAPPASAAAPAPSVPPPAPASEPSPAAFAESDIPSVDGRKVSGGTTSPLPAATENTQAPLSEVWYRTLRDGQPTGWRHVVWTRSSFEGRPTVHDRTESFHSSTRRMGRMEDTFESREERDIERTEDGLLLRSDVSTTQAGDRVTRSVWTWTGKGYESTTTVAGSEERRTVPGDAPCPLDAESFLSQRVRRGEVAVGDEFEYRVPNFAGRRLDTVRLTVLGRERLRLAGGEYDCFRVKEAVDRAPGEATWWIDASGVVRRLAADRLETVASSEAEAKDLREGGAVFSITFDADPAMPRCTSLDRALVEVTIAAREGSPMPAFPDTPFSREVSREGPVIRLELRAHDAPAEAVALPAADPSLARHLERTNLFCTDSPRVRKALAEAVGGEKDPRAMVRRILRFVFLGLRKGSGPIPEPTAEEILEAGAGDCSEHCALFVTLCRAAGVPARRLSGYAQVGDLWGSHSFAEVWLGRWVGCDPTTAEFGTRARYIAFGWEDDPDSFPGVVSARASGRMSVRTVEFTEGARTWKVDDLDWGAPLEDVLGGLAFAEPPEGWSVRLGPGSGQAQVRGPGVRAVVAVIAGYGDLTCDMLQETLMPGGRLATFAGRDAVGGSSPGRARGARLLVPYRRRALSISVSLDGAAAATASEKVDAAARLDAALATLGTMLAPTFAE